MAKQEPKAPERIRVRATRTGYYGYSATTMRRYREGDVFTLAPYTTVRREVVLGPNGRPTAHSRIVKDKQGRPIPVVVTAEQQFSHNWMEQVDDSTPERTSTAQEHIKRQHDEILAGRAPGGKAQGSSDGEEI